MSAFRRTLPARADLEQQKKLAKELLASLRRGDPEARARVRAALPDKQRIGLTDAQFVLAREYGFANWSALKQRIEALDVERLTPNERFRRAVRDGDAAALRRLLPFREELRGVVNAPSFGFDSPALVAVAGRGSGARARAGWRRPDTTPLRALSPRRRSLARRRGGSQCRRRRSSLHPGAMDDRRRRRPGGIAPRPGEISRRAWSVGRHLSCRRAGPNESRSRDARGRSVAADAADVAGRVRREAAEQLSHLSMDDRAEHDPAPNGGEV